MASQRPPKTTAPYEFDPRDVGPSPPPIGMRQPRHYVKATICGNARKGQPMTALWEEVDCPECLKSAPKGTNR